MKVRELLPSSTTSCRSVSCLPCVGCPKKLVFTHNVLIPIDLQEGVKEKNGNRLTRARARKSLKDSPFAELQRLIAAGEHQAGGGEVANGEMRGQRVDTERRKIGGMAGTDVQVATVVAIHEETRLNQKRIGSTHEAKNHSA